MATNRSLPQPLMGLRMLQLMSDTTKPAGTVTERLGILARDFEARIVNYSPTGCLLETNSPIEVGTIGTLCFVIDGRERADDVQIVRCQPIEGSGRLFQVGARFLWTGFPGRDSLRLALGRTAADPGLGIVATL
jgi:hypothetical protein